MRKIYPFFTLFTLISSCGYWPFIDGLVLLDYNAKNISFNNSRLMDDEKIIVNLDGKLFVPNKRRSKNLKMFFADFDLSIEKNLVSDTLTLDLNQANIRLTNGKETLSGIVERPDRDVSESLLVIIGKKFYVKQGSLLSNTILFDFPYSKGLDPATFKPRITIEFAGFKSKGNQILPTTKVEGSVQ